jgi:predicted dehydrogenase
MLARSDLGRLYRVRWIARGRRGRTGIDYQPETRWFTDRSRNGGGVLMDWSPYDFTMLNDILQPQSVEILHAWTATPRARVPVDMRVDVEFHVGATLVYCVPGGVRVPVTFERSSCTHGEELSAFEFEGEDGAAQLTWTGAKNELRLTRDEEGKPVTESIPCEPHALKAHERPLAQFLELTSGRPSHSAANEQAVFNFQCLQAVYACAETGRAQIVDKGKLL